MEKTSVFFFFLLFTLLSPHSPASATIASDTESAPSHCTTRSLCSPRYRVLIINDDSIDAPGIRFLADALAQDPAYDVRVAAPATGQSGVAAKITLGGEIQTTPRHDAFQGVSWAMAVGGSPVDSLRVGLHLCGPAWQPDMVLSGVNLGNNLGMCALYSGTVSAALDSVLLGFPTIAFSYDVPSYGRPPTEDEITDMGATIRATCPAIVARFRANGVPAMHVANINIPHPGHKTDNNGAALPPSLVLAAQSLSVLKSGYSDAQSSPGRLNAMMTTLDTDRSRSLDPRLSVLALPLDVDVVKSGDMSLTLTPAWPLADIVAAYTNVSKWIN